VCFGVLSWILVLLGVFNVIGATKTSFYPFSDVLRTQLVLWGLVYVFSFRVWRYVIRLFLVLGSWYLMYNIFILDPEENPSASVLLVTTMVAWPSICLFIITFVLTAGDFVFCAVTSLVLARMLPYLMPHLNGASLAFPALLRLVSGHALVAITHVLIVNRLRQSRDTAQAAVIVRDRIVATTSHELRTPLYDEAKFSRV
jgi:signal transduction histidine kinase